MTDPNPFAPSPASPDPAVGDQPASPPASDPERETLIAERDRALAAAVGSQGTAERALADYANLKRRSAADRERDLDRARSELLLRVLELADDFDLAVEHLPAGMSDDPWFAGITAIDRKLRVLLEHEQVAPIEAKGQPFDPTLHEAIAHISDSEVPGGEVVWEIRRGYLLNGRILRPTLVAVSDGSLSLARSDEQTGQAITPDADWAQPYDGELVPPSAEGEAEAPESPFEGYESPELAPTLDDEDDLEPEPSEGPDDLPALRPAE